MTFWQPGTQIMWRYGRPGDDFAAPMTVVQDDEQALVAWLAVGSPVLKLVREDGRDLRADKSDGFLVARRQVAGTTTRSRDHVLDVWVEPNGVAERKDEDELVLAVEQGRCTQQEADAITATAGEIEEIVRAWGPPFCDGWDTFTPDPRWPIPALRA